MHQHRWVVVASAAVAALVPVAMLAPAAPARAEVGAVVHLWLTGPAEAPADGTPATAHLHLTQDPGSQIGFVLANEITFEVVPPSGGSPGALAIRYEYFSTWRPVPINTPVSLDVPDISIGV